MPLDSSPLPAGLPLALRTNPYPRYDVLSRPFTPTFHRTLCGKKRILSTHPLLTQELFILQEQSKYISCMTVSGNIISEVGQFCKMLKAFPEKRASIVKYLWVMIVLKIEQFPKPQTSRKLEYANKQYDSPRGGSLCFCKGQFGTHRSCPRTLSLSLNFFLILIFLIQNRALIYIVVNLLFFG